MANASTHRLGAAAAVGLINLIHELRNEEKVHPGRPLLAAALAAMAATLPDLIEPATNPHHRQFFHSLACAVLMGYGAYRLCQWEPQEDWQKMLRFCSLVVGGAYLVHLTMDACTPSSLPLV